MTKSRSLNLAVCLLTLSTAAVTSGCGESDVSLTAPTSALQVSEPAPATFTLTGRVMESAPTTPTGISGAVLTIVDGVNVGRSAVSDVWGFYSIGALQATSFMINVAADGYVGASRMQFPTANRADFLLAPVPGMHRYQFSGEISGSDGTCDDGSAARPCRILMVPVHNPGHIHGTLRWRPGDLADLDLTLFQTGASVPIAPIERATATNTALEQVVADVRGGATYEFRITYRAGSHNVNYELTVTYPD